MNGREEEKTFWELLIFLRFEFVILVWGKVGVVVVVVIVVVIVVVVVVVVMIVLGNLVRIHLLDWPSEEDEEMLEFGENVEEIVEKFLVIVVLVVVVVIAVAIVVGVGVDDVLLMLVNLLVCLRGVGVHL